jgi:hypothetical protein
MSPRTVRCQGETPVVALFTQTHARQSEKASRVHPIIRTPIICRQIQPMQCRAAAAFEIRLIPHSPYFGSVAVQGNPGRF